MTLPFLALWLTSPFCQGVITARYPEKAGGGGSFFWEVSPCDLDSQSAGGADSPQQGFANEELPWNQHEEKEGGGVKPTQELQDLN